MGLRLAVVERGSSMGAWQHGVVEAAVPMNTHAMWVCSAGVLHAAIACMGEQAGWQAGAPREPLGSCWQCTSWSTVCISAG